MADNNEPSTAPVPPGPPVAGDSEVKPSAPQSNQAASGNHDPTEQLKNYRKQSHLPADLREQILARLPPPEERERLLRELQAQGGLSAEEFFASLGVEVGHQP